MPDPVYDSRYYQIRDQARAYAYGRFDQWIDSHTPRTPLIHSDRFAERAAGERLLPGDFPALYATMISEGGHLVYRAEDDRPGATAPVDLEGFTPAVDQ